MAALFREGLQRLDLGEVLVRRPALEKFERGQARPSGECLAPMVLAGEQSAGEREIGQLPKAVLLAGRNRIALALTLQQAPLVLRCDEADKVMFLGFRFSLSDLRAREVRAAHRSYFALTHQVIQSRQGLLDRRSRIRVVHLVEIEPLRTQPL